MPKSGSSDIPHVSIHDHYIRKKISNEGQKKLREFLGLKSINNPNPDSTTIAKAYINHFEKFDPQIRFLDSAKKYLGQITDSEKFHAFVQLLFNQKDFEGIKNKIIFIGTDSVLKKLTNSENIENNAAWTCYRAAEAFLSSGNVKIAKLFLEQSVQLAPYHLEFRNKLGVCEMHLGNKSSARKLFTSIIMDYPKDAKAFTNLGYLDALDNDFISAENNYQTALRIDPDNIKALLNFGGMQILKNKFPEGGSLLITALKIENGNKRTQQMIFALFQQLKISGRHKEFELLFTKLKKAVPSSSLLKELNQIK